MFQFFYLRGAIFFGCVGIFSNLFRGEMLEKTLHYYYLTPVRRELLVVGKYLRGTYGGAVLFCHQRRGIVLLHWRATSAPPTTTTSFTVPVCAQLGWYVLVAALACADTARSS